MTRLAKGTKEAQVTKGAVAGTLGTPGAPGAARPEVGAPRAGTASAAAESAKKGRRARREAAWLAFRRDRGAVVAVALLLVIVTACAVAPLLPLQPNATDIANRLAPPSLEHVFGTDELGRDYLARILYGGRVSLAVGVLAMLTSLAVGILVGTVAGLFGGIVDAVLMRVVDVLSSIPWMVLVTVVSILLTPGLTSIILVIGLFSWMEIARLVRAETQRIKGHDFVQYAELCGVSRLRIIMRHVIPSAFPTIITAATTSLAGAIMTESSLSFLGVGVQQPMSSWGSLLQAAQATMQNNIYMAFIPGLLIVIVIFAFNKLGNVMRVFADPQIMSGEWG